MNVGTNVTHMFVPSDEVGDSNAKRPSRKMRSDVPDRIWMRWPR